MPMSISPCVHIRYNCHDSGLTGRVMAVSGGIV